jgi:bifunctional DNA-binding transcriptional regulator/antitoxin component of YhaV-PrlF toxin-antitoxin module
MVVLIPSIYQARARRSRISSKHQLTIPASAFRGAGFAAGDLVRVEAEGQGRVVLTKVDDLGDRYSGSLATGGELRRSVEGAPRRVVARLDSVTAAGFLDRDAGPSLRRRRRALWCATEH